MPRYTKSYSNYILRKIHSKTYDGTIFERDWGTLGERHVIEPGKKKVYSDGNFLFTDNNMPGLRKRNNRDDWSDAYSLDNLDTNVNDDVNNTSLLSGSNDIRDYAYYGSASELVRATIEKIIREFPGRFYATDNTIQKLSDDGESWLYINSIMESGSGFNITWGYNIGNVVSVMNPFEMDFYNQNAVFGDNDNRMRNLPVSWSMYVNENEGGTEEPMTSWNVTWSRQPGGCLKDYDILHSITFSYGGARAKHLWGMYYQGSVVWLTDDKSLNAHPNETIREDYFRNLEGFEAKLLDRRTRPLYMSEFLTPIRRSPIDDRYQYVERKYIWPSTGYCIDVGTVSYYGFVESLSSLASVMDELWCDNIWSSMTHEAIKNFDWTYTRDYEEGEDEANIAGGSRMEGMLRIMGRFYDDIKRYVDGISLKNRVTYDGVGGIGNAEVSDKAELNGWEVFSTKVNENTNMRIGDFVETSVEKLPSRYGEGSDVNHQTWYNVLNPEYVTQNNVDNDFMRRITLSAKSVFSHKGTKHSIDMVMGLFGVGDEDYSMEERYYSVVPKRRDDIFWFYEPNEEPEDESEYQDMGQTLMEYCESKNYKLDGSSPRKAIFGSMFYDLRGDMTVGEFCAYITTEKDVRRNYQDDEFSGAPLKDVYIGNEHYIVPYFSQKKIYDGNVQFETLGGWGKTADAGYDISVLEEEEFDYMETIPYMEVVQKCGELLTVNMFDVKGKKIYYVMDISDLTEYAETIPDHVSHFFKLDDELYPHLFSSWKNVPFMDGDVSESEYDHYCAEYGLCEGVTYSDYRLAKYLDGILFDNVGNNPHIGFGRYDLGREYREYMEKPFKYVAENYGFSDFNYCDVAAQLRFEVTEYNDEKIKNLIYDGEENPEEQDAREDGEELVYYEPSKLLVITNNIDSEWYRRYFIGIIRNYLLQVIPSTTILVLVGFTPSGKDPDSDGIGGDNETGDTTDNGKVTG